MIEDKPIVLLYSAGFAKKWDQGVIDFTKAEFPKEFGGRVPWIAPQDSWRVKGDNTCYWGGALGYRNPGIGEIGPGYDHSAVPGRTPLVRDREDGKFYEESWLKFLRRPTPFVMIETWNEFHEGTDIAESKEYGRRYIELTRKYSELFKKGWQAPWPKGSFNNSLSVSTAPAHADGKSGLRLLTPEDGQALRQKVGERDAWLGQPFRGAGGSYLYFRVDDSFKQAGGMNATVEIEYFDGAPGTLHMEFDGSDLTAPFNGAYSPSSQMALKGEKQWNQASFDLTNAVFNNSQNGGADFRIVAQAHPFAVGKVILRKR